MGRLGAAAPSAWITLLLATASVGIANSVVFTLLSDLQDTYGFGDAGLGMIAGAGMAVGFVSQLLLAPLADRGHSNRLLIGGLAAAVTGSVVFAVASTLPVLVLARAIVGLSNGLFLPAARAVAASLSDERVGERLGTLGGVELAGFVTGPMVGALLVGPFGVRVPFLVCGVAALLAMVALSRRPLPRPPISDRPHALGLDLLRLREMRVGVLLTMALFFPVGMYDAILDRYMTDRGASNLLIGTGFLMYGIPFALLATLGGRMADRHGALRISLISLAMVAPITAVYGALSAPIVITLLFAVEGATQALGVPASQAYVAQVAPYGRASAAQGLSGALNLLGGTVSAIAGPAVYGRWGAGVTFGGTGLLVAIAGVAAWTIHRRTPATIAAAPLS